VTVLEEQDRKPFTISWLFKNRKTCIGGTAGFSLCSSYGKYLWGPDIL
jgi:hypothetical protein